MTWCNHPLCTVCVENVVMEKIKNKIKKRGKKSAIDYSCTTCTDLYLLIYLFVPGSIYVKIDIYVIEEPIRNYSHIKISLMNNYLRKIYCK